MNTDRKKNKGEKGLVSVIMPSYNRGYIIQRAIDSVKNQTYRNWELIIVDDGSTDDTESIVKKNKEKNIHYIAYSPNKGGNHARNIGMSAARGEYFSFLDTDCEWMPEFLEKRLLDVKKYDADIVFGKIKIVHPKYEYIFPVINLVELNELNNIEILTNCILSDSIIDTNTVLFRKTCLEKGFYFCESLKRLQDWEYFLRLVRSNYFVVGFGDDILSISFVQSDSISNKDELYWPSLLYIVEKNLDIYRGNENCLAKVICKALRYKASCLNDEAINKLCVILKMMSMSKILELLKENFVDQDRIIKDQDRIIKEQDRIIKEQDEIIKGIGRISAKNSKIIEIATILLWENDTLRTFCIKNGLSRIIIHGYGLLGRILYDKFILNNINVVAIIDQKNVTSKTKILSNYEGIPEADIIVITAIDAFDEIIKIIPEKYKGKTICIDKIIEEGEVWRHE